MKRLFIFVLFLVFSTALLQGCGGDGGGGGSSNLADSIPTDPVVPPVDGDDGTDGDGGTGGGGGAGSVGVLGKLIDLGDLFYPDGDHWYFTLVRDINDKGIVIGQSNNRSPLRGAFKWDVATAEMTFLGMHNGNFDDYYGQRTTDIIEPTPFIYSEAVALNINNQIIGNSTTGQGWPDEAGKRAFLWKDNQFIDLPPLTNQSESRVGDSLEIFSYSEAKDINNAGEIILTMSDGLPGGNHAYYWDGISTRVYTLPRDDNTTLDITGPDYVMLGRIIGSASDAVAINENGQAIINSGSTAIFHDLNWDIVEPLNQLPGATFTSAVDINDSNAVNNDGIPDGHVIGNSGSFAQADVEAFLNNSFLGAAEEVTLASIGGAIQGFFWDGGAMYPVNHLGGGKSIAADINNKDQVVGGALTAEGKTHAILWTLGPDKKGIIKDIGTLGGENSMALKINEAGQVVGWSETGDLYEEQGVLVPIRHAFFWNSGVMYDLGVHDDFYDYPFTPPYPFSESVALNELGELAGNSITINSFTRGFYLKPVIPAP